VYAKFRYTALRIKKALGVFRELTTTTTTTRVAFWEYPPSGPKISLKSASFTNEIRWWYFAFNGTLL